MFTKTIRFTTIVLVVVLIMGTFANVRAASNASPVNAPKMAAFTGQSQFSTGWWIDRETGSAATVTTYSGQGDNRMLLSGWFVDRSQLASTITYLDAAQKAGAQLIIGLEGGATPTMSQTDIQYVVSALKSHPALYGYYVADEPELNVDAATLQSRHATLQKYYSWIKAIDSTHPIMISFNEPYAEKDWANQAIFYPDTDIIGIHAYPFWSTGGEFGTNEGRSIYDVWKRGKANADSLGKGFIATMQGFGNNSGYPYKNPTLNELRYEVFSAVALGVNTEMFWIDSWGVKSGMMDIVKTVIAQENEISAQMMAGVTTTTDKLVIRSGIANNTGAILAVNIANRSGSGSTFTAQFTVPANVSQVTVKGENRTIAVSGGVFGDSFKPFEVHNYTFSVGSSATLTPISVSSTPTITPAWTPTAALTKTFTPTQTATPTTAFTATNTATFTPIPSFTPTKVSNTATASVPSATPGNTATSSPTPMPASATPVASPTPTLTALPPTATSTPTTTLQPTATLPPATATAIFTATPTSLPATFTSTPTATATNAPAESTPTQSVPTAAPAVLPTATTTAPTATPVGQPPVAPTRIKYDDNNPALVYSTDDWTGVKDRRAYEDGYQRTRRQKASVAFTFTGQTFFVVFSACNTCGDVDVYLDGVKVDTFSEKAARARYQQLYHYRDWIKPGQHELRLVFTGPKGSLATLDGIIIVQRP